MTLLKKIKYGLAAIVALPSYIAAFRYGGIRLTEDMAVWIKKTDCPFVNRFWAYVYLMSNYPPFRNIVYYRINSEKQHSIFQFRGWALMPAQKDIYIVCDEIGGGFYISHGYATVIYAKCIGRNFHAFQSITIGQKNGLVPTIGDNVTIYSGARVFGDIMIGDNVEVGANAVVLRDIPSNSIAVGIPAVSKEKQQQQPAVSANENPLVSVVVLTYNQVDVVEETLKALFLQTYPCLEFVISDDCSTDGTWEKIKEWENILSAKGKVILNRQNTNMGITANYNKAFSLCTGKVIVINEGDDISVSDRISHLVDVFMSKSPVLIQSGYKLMFDRQVVENQNNIAISGGV